MSSEKIEVPTRHSQWKHYNGCEYKVIEIANCHSVNERYPITVVYMGNNGRVWCRPLSDWHRSMTKLEN